LAKNIESAELKIPVEVIDIDENSSIAVEYGIRSVPTLIMLDENIEVKRVSGALNPQKLKEWVE
jgi:thioredoxin 1